MARLSKEALTSASDLKQKEVDLPSIGGSVIVRALPAAYSNQAQSDATELKNTSAGEQFVSVNVARLEAIQVLHGMVDPKFDSLEEVEEFASNVGPAWVEIVRTIDKLSAIDKEAIEAAEARFPRGGGEQASGNGTAAAGDKPRAEAATGS